MKTKITDIVITSDDSIDIKVEINLFKRKKGSKRWKRMIDWEDVKI